MRGDYNWRAGAFWVTALSTDTDSTDAAVGLARMYLSRSGGNT